MAGSSKRPTVSQQSSPGVAKRSWLFLGSTAPKTEDVAADFLANLDPAISAPPISHQEEKKLLRKVDWILIPIMSATIILAAVDKVIISNAAIFGMLEGANLKGDEYAWVGSIFYIGYLLFELPAAYLIQRLPVAKFLVLAVVSWGVLMLCTAATSHFAGLATCRFLMGMMEVLVFPISAIITAMWWKRSEQPIRIAFWNSQGSSVIAGLVSYGIGHARTSVARWRLLFLVLGAFSLLWAVVLYFLLPDSPVSCSYLSEREKYVCLQRVKQNNTGMEEKKVKWYQVRECLMEPRTWLLSIFAIAQNIPNGGLITFSSIIVSGLGYSKLVTTLLGIPTGVVATTWQLVWSLVVAQFPNGRCITIAIMDLVPITCALLMWQLPRENQSGLLAAYYCFYSYWGPYVLAASLPMANCSGHSKKLTTNAIFFMSYCIGNIIGPQLFRPADAPSYSNGYAGMLACLVVAMASILGYGWLCARENRRRDNDGSAEETHLDAEEAFTDLTDREKAAFRYVY